MSDFIDWGPIVPCRGTVRKGLLWDEDMGCVVRAERCSCGCSNSMAWIRPEDATQEERDELGLVESDG